MIISSNLGELEYNGKWSGAHECPLLKMAVHKLAAFEKKGELAVFTSGSTGPPKKIYWSKNLIEWSAQATYKTLELSQNEKVLIPISIEKTGGLMLLLRSFIYNWDVHIIPPSADPFSQISADHLFTFTSLVPYQLHHILKSKTSTSKMLKLKNVLLGGSVLDPRLEQSVIKTCSHAPITIWHGYGMTETASHIALRTLDDHENKFTLQPGVDITHLENGAAGIKIPKIKFDIATRDILDVKDQQVSFIGRVDDVINSGSIKLHPNLIYSKISKVLSGAVPTYFLAKEKDPVFGECLVIVIESTSTIDIKKMMSRIQLELENYEIPKVVYSCKNFTYLKSGKIDKESSKRNAQLISSAKPS